VQLGDFGVSRVLEASRGDLAITTCGTPMYMAPELYKGRDMTDRHRTHAHTFLRTPFFFVTFFPVPIGGLLTLRI
jgi:serine/threonine protein kinase